MFSKLKFVLKDLFARDSLPHPRVVAITTPITLPYIATGSSISAALLLGIPLKKNPGGISPFGIGTPNATFEEEPCGTSFSF